MAIMEYEIRMPDMNGRQTAINYKPRAPQREKFEKIKRFSFCYLHGEEKDYRFTPDGVVHCRLEIWNGGDHVTDVWFPFRKLDGMQSSASEFAFHYISLNKKFKQRAVQLIDKLVTDYERNRLDESEDYVIEPTHFCYSTYIARWEFLPMWISFDDKADEWRQGAADILVDTARHLYTYDIGGVDGVRVQYSPTTDRKDKIQAVRHLFRVIEERGAVPADRLLVTDNLLFRRFEMLQDGKSALNFWLPVHQFDYQGNSHFCYQSVDRSRQLHDDVINELDKRLRNPNANPPLDPPLELLINPASMRTRGMYGIENSDDGAFDNYTYEEADDGTFVWGIKGAVQNANTRISTPAKLGPVAASTLIGGDWPAFLESDAAGEFPISALLEFDGSENFLKTVVTDRPVQDDIDALFCMVHMCRVLALFVAIDERMPPEEFEAALRKMIACPAFFSRELRLDNMLVRVFLQCYFLGEFADLCDGDADLQRQYKQYGRRIRRRVQHRKAYRGMRDTCRAIQDD